jgi:hypothetical protein
MTPTPFDVPSRQIVVDLEWVARSYLSFIGDEFEARAILGFSWGFAVVDRQITVTSIQPLADADWDDHVQLLRDEHSAWRFAPGPGLRDGGIVCPAWVGDEMITKPGSATR